MLAAVIHCLRGTPYIYQGEELGMTNAGFTDISQYKDVESLNHFRILQEKGLSEENAYQILQIHSRDNSRTPMQWTAGENGGFTEGKPWIEVNKNCSTINAEAEMKDETSVFAFYKKLVQLRKDYDIIAYGDFEPKAEKNLSIFAYKRYYRGKELLVIGNFYGTPVRWDAGEDLEAYECLLGNYDEQELKGTEAALKPYETMILYK